MKHISAAAFAAGLLAVLSIPAATPADADGFGFATYSAFVKANGVTSRGNGIQASARLGAGRYWIEFPRDVTSCFYTATPVGNAGGSISIHAFSGNPNRRRVFTYNANGVRTDLGFNIMVRCVP